MLYWMVCDTQRMYNIDLLFFFVYSHQLTIFKHVLWIITEICTVFNVPSQQSLKSSAITRSQ